MGVSLKDLLDENSNPILEDKSKKAINMLLVVISIIVVLIAIVAIIAINKNNELAQLERAKKLTADIDSISAYAKNLYSEYRTDGDITILQGKSQEDLMVHEIPFTITINGHKEEYKYGYYYATADLVEQMVTTLNIKGEDYVINYSNGDVINAKGVKYKGKTYYSVDDLRAIAQGVTPPSEYTIYINAPEDMMQLHEHPNGYFKLGQDIDMTSYATGDGWKPVPSFSGHFEGRGYKISNLVVSRTSESYCGLFGQVKSGATINNLKLIDVNVSGGEYTGAIAGACSGSISNCTVTGIVNGQTSNVGGVFGLYENGVAQNIIATMTVNGNEYVGGFVGTLTSGKIQYCSQNGRVTGNNKTGGFVGRITPTGATNLNQVSSNCEIISAENAGGLIGSVEILNSSELRILDSYARGQISSCSRVAGGFVGNLSTVAGSSIDFTSVYTVVDTPSLADIRGGFAGRVTSAGTNTIIQNCFWEKDNLQDKDLEEVGESNNMAITFESHSPAEMRTIATFGKWDMKVWKFTDGNTPVLNWQ